MVSTSKIRRTANAGTDDNGVVSIQSTTHCLTTL